VIAEELEPPTRVVRGQPPEKPEPPPPKEPAPAPPSFPFPDDPAGQLLSRHLTPSPRQPLPEPPSQQRRPRAPAQLETPESPLPPSQAGRLPLPLDLMRRPLHPRLVTPDVLFSAGMEVAMPAAISMPSGERTRMVGVDVNLPAPLPRLGQPVPDRASLADATGEASGAAVVSATMPIRRLPIAFQRLGIPDPFEFRQPLRLPLPPEGTNPIAGPPRLPQ